MVVNTRGNTEASLVSSVFFVTWVRGAIWGWELDIFSLQRSYVSMGSPLNEWLVIVAEHKAILSVCSCLLHLYHVDIWGAGLGIYLLTRISQLLSAWPCIGRLSRSFRNFLILKSFASMSFGISLGYLSCVLYNLNVRFSNHPQEIFFFLFFFHIHSKFSSEIHILLDFKLSFLELRWCPVREYRITLVLA